MKSGWVDGDAETMVERYAAQGVGRDVALRVYTSRLLGRDPLLVLHGGGNTSVKTTVKDFLGDAVEVLCVKGSGWDMANIEPAGLPTVGLGPLKRLRARGAGAGGGPGGFPPPHPARPGAPHPAAPTPPP